MAGSTVSPSGSSLISRIYDFLRRVPLWFIVVIFCLATLWFLDNYFSGRKPQRFRGWWHIPNGGTAADPANGVEGANTFESGPFVVEELTFDNYETVLAASATADLFKALVNSAAIVIPATIIPIAFAAFAAYGFAWIDFKGRKLLFTATVSLLAVPLQVALLPLLKLYVGGAHITLPFIEKTITLVPDWDLNGSATAVWLTHTGFAMPFAIFLLHNYISGLPRDIFESARIDGADHLTIFWRLVLPLSIPVLAAFAIFQFLWTWNDYLIALTMIGANRDAFPSTIRIANLAGDFGRNEHLLPSAAFVQAFVPMAVFFSLQRYFVRGILAGSVKG